MHMVNTMQRRSKKEKNKKEEEEILRKTKRMKIHYKIF